MNGMNNNNFNAQVDVKQEEPSEVHDVAVDADVPPRRGPGRPRKSETNNPTSLERRPRGRPRIHEKVDPEIPRRKRGRPRKDQPKKARGKKRVHTGSDSDDDDSFSNCSSPEFLPRRNERDPRGDPNQMRVHIHRVLQPRAVNPVEATKNLARNVLKQLLSDAKWITEATKKRLLKRARLFSGLPSFVLKVFRIIRPFYKVQNKRACAIKFMKKFYIQMDPIFKNNNLCCSDIGARKYNTQLIPCHQCGRRWHKSCGMILGSGRRYICQDCHGGGHHLTADCLDHTRESEYIENHVNSVVRNVIDENVEEALVRVRTLYHTDEKILIPNGTLNNITNGKQSKYREKAIYAFNRKDGFDIVIFSMIVQEYQGANGHKGNHDLVHVAFLDGLKLYNPEGKKTIIFQSILAAYAMSARIRGFKKIHIWSAASPINARPEYIIYGRPQETRFPEQPQLNKWYRDTMNQLKNDGVVSQILSLRQLIEKEGITGIPVCAEGFAEKCRIPLTNETWREALVDIDVTSQAVMTMIFTTPTTAELNATQLSEHQEVIHFTYNRERLQRLQKNRRMENSTLQRAKYTTLHLLNLILNERHMEQ